MSTRKPSPLLYPETLSVRLPDKLYSRLSSAKPLDSIEQSIVRQIYGIAPHIHLQRSWWSKALLWIFRNSIFSLRANVARAARLLQGAQTYEGRQLIFKNHIVGIAQSFEYSPQTDLALTRLTRVCDPKMLDRLQRCRVDLILAALTLGLTDLASVTRLCERLRSPSIHANIVLQLVDEGFVTTPEELAALKELNWPARWHSIDFAPIKDCLSAFVEHDLAVAGALPHVIQHAEHLAPYRLQETLNLLRARGFPLEPLVKPVLDAMGQTRWQADPLSWRYVLDVIQVQDVEELLMFIPLLTRRAVPPPALVGAMRELGARTSDLAACQEVLCEVTNVQDFIERLKLLLAHGLSYEQLGRTRCYLLRESQQALVAHLRHLADHGLARADTLVLFETLFGATGETLRVILDLTVPRLAGEPPSAVLQWKQRLDKTKAQLLSLRYLSDHLSVPDLHALTQALRPAEMSRGLLRFLIEDKGFASVHQLSDWYYGPGWGAKEFRDDSLDGLTRILVEDAYKRGTIALLPGNVHMMVQAIWAITDQREVLEWKYPETPPSISDRAQVRQTLRVRVEIEVAQALPQCLALNAGTILPSLLCALVMGSPDPEQLLYEIRSLNTDLATGRGPTTTEIDSISEEAVALMYEVSPDAVQHWWSKVCGQDSHIQSWALRQDYAMQWSSMERYCPKDKVFRPRAFESLALAVRMAGALEGAAAEELREVCKGLSPRRLSDPKIDERGLHRHLGILLAVAMRNTSPSFELISRFESAAHLEPQQPDAYAKVLGLIDAFTTDLPDAVHAGLDGFVVRQKQDDALWLAQRMGYGWGDPSSTRFELGCLPTIHATGRQCLETMLRESLKRCREVYLRWLKREKAKFVEIGQGGAMLHVTAVVSKHPAAFFAKVAANICTSANLAMWQEDRHAHLLFVEPVAKRILGLAYVYRQVIAAIDPVRPCLLIRGINPSPKAVARYDPSSIVEAVLNAAVHIASDAGCAALAIPQDSGQDWWSNRREITTALKKRLAKIEPTSVSHTQAWAIGGRSCGDSMRRAPFYAYQQGEGAVHDFYIWWRSPAFRAHPQSHCVATPSLECQERQFQS